MNKRLVVLILLLTLLLSACQKAPPESNVVAKENETIEKEVMSDVETANKETQTSEAQSLQDYMDESFFPILLEEHANYKLYTDQQHHGYYYEIYDNNADCFAMGYGSWRLHRIDAINESLVLVRNGSGGALYTGQYFDIENARVSRIFPTPRGVSENYLVAYFDIKNSEIVLVVRDIFDANKYYVEFRDESFTSSVFLILGKAQFSADGTCVAVTYPSPHADNQMVTKEFALP